MTTSAADTPSPRWISVGIPRPSSRTLQEPSGLSVTTPSFAKPASASSMALSTTSYTMWCRPEPSSVSPIYMPGRLRTASRPRSTLIDCALYSPSSGGSTGSLIDHCPCASARRDDGIGHAEKLSCSLELGEQRRIGPGEPRLAAERDDLAEQRGAALAVEMHG